MNHVEIWPNISVTFWVEMSSVFYNLSYDHEWLDLLQGNHFSHKENQACLAIADQEDKRMIDVQRQI